MLRMNLVRGALLGVLALTIIGCGGGVSTGQSAPPIPTRPVPTQAPAVSTPRPTVSVPPTTQPSIIASPTPGRPSAIAPQPVPVTPRPLTELDQAIALAQADLAKRLGVTIQAIQVAQADAVEWPNLGLGCPEPGMMYGAVITPGFKIMLTSGNQTYAYHGDRKGNMRLCEQNQPVPVATLTPNTGAGGGGGSGATIDPRLTDQVAAAKKDLTDRVKTLKVDTIRVTSAVEMVWNDGSLGCPEPGMMYTQALVPGYRIVLEAEGKMYSYHGAKDRPPRLCEAPAGRLRTPGGLPIPTDPTK